MRARRPVLFLTAVAVALAPALAGAGGAGADTSGTSSYATYQAPSGMGDQAGEPSIGVRWQNNHAFYQARLETMRVTFDDSTSPATATWKDLDSPLTSVDSLDPILFTDSVTGRVFVSQLTGGCSLGAFSDDDGETFTPQPLFCGIRTLVDHQTVGGGPFAPTPPLGAVGSAAGYPHAVYYCAQDGVEGASCAVSPDGGLTFGPGTQTFRPDTCGGLHGHIKVAPDGTAYVPNPLCGSVAQNAGLADVAGAKQGFARSRDNGTTWDVVTVPDSSTQFESDPSIGIGSDGTVYFGYEAGDGHPRIAVYHPATDTWDPSVDVGTGFGIQSSQFPEVVAGDGDRAAYAFLGTATPGDDQQATFAGVWHLYVATTTDGGAHWSTVDATPSDPVQRGCISLAGFSASASCDQRNLLDVNDMSIDSTGRVLVAYADGCIGACVSDPSAPSTAQKATIARQVDGPRLFALGAPPADVAEAPRAALLPLAGAGIAGLAVVVRRRRRGPGRGPDMGLGTEGSTGPVANS